MKRTALGIWLAAGVAACATREAGKPEEPSGGRPARQTLSNEARGAPRALREAEGPARPSGAPKAPKGEMGGLVRGPRPMALRARAPRPLEADLGPGASGPSGRGASVRVTRLANVETSHEQEIRLEVLRRLRSVGCLAARGEGSYEVRVSAPDRLSVAGGEPSDRRCLGKALKPMVRRLLDARRGSGPVVLGISVSGP